MVETHNDEITPSKTTTSTSSFATTGRYPRGVKGESRDDDKHFKEEQRKILYCKLKCVTILTTLQPTKAATPRLVDNTGGEAAMTAIWELPTDSRPRRSCCIINRAFNSIFPPGPSPRRIKYRTVDPQLMISLTT